MVRIGIIGSDNSHAFQYARLANILSADEGGVTDCHVVSIYGTDPDKTAEVAEKGSISRIVDHPEDMLGEVDLVCVVWRHGELHLKAALPFLKAGVPTFVDKPFAVTTDDCYEMLETARTNYTLISSFSNVRWASGTSEMMALMKQNSRINGGCIVGSCDFSSPYGGLFFYAIHAVELMLQLFGNDVAEVSAKRYGDTGIVLATYATGMPVSVHLMEKTAPKAVVFTENGGLERNMLGKDNYARAMQVMLDMVTSGRRPLTDEDMVTPIKVLMAIDQSAKSNAPVKL